MHELVIAAGVTLLLVVASVSLVAGLFLRGLSRSNRVLPDRRSEAPLTWLWSWSAAARLHRRLRRAVGAAACMVAPFRPARRSRRRPEQLTSPLVDVADTLMARAALIDDRLVVASRTAPQWRAPLLADLRRGVAEVEASAAHLGRVAATWRAQMDAVGLDGPLPALDLRSRLEAVEAALAEVAHAERSRTPAGVPAAPGLDATRPLAHAMRHDAAGPLAGAGAGAESRPLAGAGPGNTTPSLAGSRERRPL